MLVEVLEHNGLCAKEDLFDITTEMHRPVARRGEVEDAFDREGREVCIAGFVLPLSDDGGAPPIGDGVARLGFDLPIAIGVAATEESTADFEFGEAAGDSGGVDLGGWARIGVCGAGQQSCACCNQDETRPNHDRPPRNSIA